MNTFLLAVIAACKAYASSVQWRQETQLDRIEDEIDRLASDGSPASKLRMERLALRLTRKREHLRALRPADSDPS